MSKPILPPPSRRDRPVKMIRKVEVSPEDIEKDQSTAEPEEHPVESPSPSIHIRKISPTIEPPTEEEETPVGVYPSRRRRNQVKRIRREPVMDEATAESEEVDTDLAETDGREAVENPPPWYEAPEGDWEEVNSSIEGSELPAIEVDEDGFRVDLPEMDEDGDWEDGLPALHGSVEVGKKFWQVAEVAATDEDGDTEEEWEEPEDAVDEIDEAESEVVETRKNDIPEKKIVPVEEVVPKTQSTKKLTLEPAEERPKRKPKEPKEEAPKEQPIIAVSERWRKAQPKRIVSSGEMPEEPAKPVARKRRRRWPWFVLFLLLLGGAVFTAWYLRPGWFQFDSNEPKENCLGIQIAMRKGMELEKMTCTVAVMADGESLESLLIANKVDWKQPLQLIQKLGALGISLPGKGTKYTFLYLKKDPLHPAILAYEPSPGEMVLLALQGEAEVYRYKRPKLSSQYIGDGAMLTKSFAETMFNRQSGLDLTQMVYDAMKWKLDLFELKEGDQFKMVYSESVYEGGNKMLDGLEAIQFQTESGLFTAFHYQDELVDGFFDEEARPVKSPFLMMPLRYGRISSPFSYTRLDPFSENGEIRPHLGTDYAAPEGTEIIAVADGFVDEATFSPSNGNYVKLSHIGGIQTQYLHMVRIGEGIIPGQFVQQGTVIGYVGMTGRATGPHVCFRYWKNGMQVDHRREKFLPPDPLSGERAANFFAKRDSMIEVWDKVDLLSDL